MSTHERGPAELEREARAAFLGNGGTGVLSFSKSGSEPPHSIPVSYGYDARDETFYFRLAVGPESEKGPLLDRGVSFVVYGQEEDRWKSVVATGKLESTTDEAISTEALDGLDYTHIPMVDVFGQPTRDVSFGFYRLAPERLTGLEETTVRE